MRTLNCRACGKMLIELEKGKIASKGLAVYCLEHDPATGATKPPFDFGELFRSLGDKARGPG